MTNEESKLTYCALHIFLVKKYGKAIYCSKCGTLKAKRYEWANITGVYTENIKDYIQLCPSCHRKMDYTEAQREKIRIINIGNKNAKKSKIMKMNLEGEIIDIYDYVYQAARQNNMLHTAIFNCLSRRSKTANGFQWIRI